MSENTIWLKSGLEVHWNPISEYVAELDKPLGLQVCRLCCERENGKHDVKIGMVLGSTCSCGCSFPKLVEEERISSENFFNTSSSVMVYDNEEKDGEKVKVRRGVVNVPEKKKDVPSYDRHASSPFRADTADDRMLSILVACGNEGISMENLYKKALPLFPDKDETTIKSTCSVFVSRFGKPNNKSGFEIVWDREPKRGRGGDPGSRRVGIVFDGQPWPSWAINKG